MPVTGAADQAADRIRLVIYVDAFMPRAGQSALDLLPKPFGAMVRAGIEQNGPQFGRKKLPLGKKGKQTQLTTPAEHKRVIRIEDTITVADLARGMGIKAPEVLKKLWGMGMTGVNINAVDRPRHRAAPRERVRLRGPERRLQGDDIFAQKADDAETLSRPRARSSPSWVTSTTARPRCSTRSARRASRPARPVASRSTSPPTRSTAPGHGDIVFLDTPGHEAFTEMRARGAQATDIVVLVVAANDGVMPQTIEALATRRTRRSRSSSRSTRSTSPTRSPSACASSSPTTASSPRSGAATRSTSTSRRSSGENIDKLLESIAVSAEMLELKANPKKPASGLVIEARLDRNRGPMATVLDPGRHAARRRHRSSPVARSARSARCSTIAASRSRRPVRRRRSRSSVSTASPRPAIR